MPRTPDRVVTLTAYTVVNAPTGDAVQGVQVRTRAGGFPTNVDDLVDGLVAMMGTPAGVTGPVNLGNPGEFTMLELADHVLAKVGGRSRVVHEPLPQDDPKVRRPDITVASEVLGWRPKVALDEGLDRAIAYFRTKLGA